MRVGRRTTINHEPDMTENAEAVATTGDEQTKVDATEAFDGSFDVAFRRLIEPLETKLLRLEQRLQASSPAQCDGDVASPSRVSSGPDAESASSQAILEEIRERARAAVETLVRLEEGIERSFAHFDERLAALTSAPPAEDCDSDADWMTTALGDDLCRDESLKESCKQLVSDLLQGDANAKTLVAHVMLVAAASQDRLPPLLKEIGEAYYRWRPKSTSFLDPWERALPAWLERRCLGEGLRNSIEIVDPGERFDSRRHQPDDRAGVRVASVWGWVVLRENGNVYSRAKVSLE